jgi:TPR repeat protein
MKTLPLLALALTSPLCATLEGEGSDRVVELRQSAEQGDAKAQSRLGVAYISGDGIAKDSIEAVKWFRKAADQSYAMAQTNLGLAYAEGEGVAQNYEEAVKWFRLAAEQGDAEYADFLKELTEPEHIGYWHDTGHARMALN